MIEIVDIVLDNLHPTFFGRNWVYKIPTTNQSVLHSLLHLNLQLNIQIMLYNHLQVNKVPDNEELDNH